MLPTADSDDRFDLAILVPDWALADFNSAISQTETVEPIGNPYRESVAAGRTALPKARFSSGRAGIVSDLRLGSLIDWTGVEKYHDCAAMRRDRAGPIAVIAGVDMRSGDSRYRIKHPFGAASASEAIAVTVQHIWGYGADRNCRHPRGLPPAFRYPANRVVRRRGLLARRHRLSAVPAIANTKETASKRLKLAAA